MDCPSSFARDLEIPTEIPRFITFFILFSMCSTGFRRDFGLVDPKKAVLRSRRGLEGS